MELMMLGGLLLIVGVMLAASSRRSLTDDCLQQAYVLKGLALAFFAVGVFNVGGGLLGLLVAASVETGYLIMGGWIFAGPLIWVFFFLFRRRRRIHHTYPHFRNEGVGEQGDNVENKGLRNSFVSVIRLHRKL